MGECRGIDFQNYMLYVMKLYWIILVVCVRAFVYPTFCKTCIYIVVWSKSVNIYDERYYSEYAGEVIT